jgi:hypothetical protein
MKEQILKIIENNSPEVATEEILQLIADNYQALQLQQTGVISSACNEYIEGINMQCARCDEPKYEHKF